MLDVKVKLVTPIRPLDKLIDQAVSKTLRDMKPIIQNTAKTQHEYTVRTGKLRNATKVDIKDKILRAFVDGRIARYGKYVHEGHGKWQPDRFIDNAVNSNQDKFEQTLINNINMKLRNKR